MIYEGHCKVLRPEFFYWLIYEPSYCNFAKSRKKIKFNLYFFLFYPPTLNIICLVEKNFFLRFCLCIFESDTVKSDCLVQIFRKMMKHLKITLLVLLFFWRY